MQRLSNSRFVTTALRQCGVFRSLSTVSTILSGPRRAVVLLSGGLDSATAMALARDDGFLVHALSFDYGQRHRHELGAAAEIAEALGAVDHRVARVDVSLFGGSALTDLTVPVPKGRHAADMASGVIPTTYVPARNTLFLSYGLALAESIGACDIYIGANAVDYSGYPDCRPEYFKQFQALADLATKAGVERGEAPQIRAPLLHWTKLQIISRGLSLGVDFGMTHSCYDPDVTTGRPCGSCDSCILRAEAFTELGFPVDPAIARYDALQNPKRKKQ